MALSQESRSRAARPNNRPAATWRLVTGWSPISAWTTASTPTSRRACPARKAFLINPYGHLFRDITPESLVKVGMDGHPVAPTPHDVNPAGFTIHSAVHMGRPDAGCVLHTHTVAGVAVSSLACGLQPVNQWALQFYNRVAYHDYEGIALDLDERERLVADLGQQNAMILRNHGLLTVGATVAEAFILMLNLDRACRVQLAIQSTGQATYPVSAQVSEKTARQYASGDTNRPPGSPDPSEREWRALLAGGTSAARPRLADALDGSALRA